MGTRENILEATKSLLWLNGYEATSPKDIQAMSKAGQGSFYHHFASKKELVLTAITEIVADRIEAFERAIAGNASFKERIGRFLALDKQPFIGCRVGRLVWDAAVQDEELRTPLHRYFAHLERRIIEEIEQEMQLGKSRLLMPATQIAVSLLAIIQGGFALSRATKTPRVDDAVNALRQFMEIVIVDVKP